MADISTYLQAIMDAVYGEDVRGSIHDAIDLINKVGEVTFTVGTAVTSQGSSITGYYTNSLYLNTDTDDLWKCDGTKWVLQGNIKGNTGQAGYNPYLTVVAITDGHRVTVHNEFQSESFDVMDGTDGFSPYITTEAVVGGTRVTVNNEGSASSFVVYNGNGGVYGDGHTIYLT